MSNYLLIFLLLFSFELYSQKSSKSDTINPAKGNVDKQLKKIKAKKIKLHSETTGNEPKKSWLIDSTFQNKYGDLLNDDPEYNKKSALWKSALGVPLSLMVTWTSNRYIFNSDYSHVGFSSWEYNLQKGWEWDNDRFGKSFLGNPYLGAIAFNASRTYGYNYYESFGFSVAGSVMWEYFGESKRPSYNNLINTSVNGAFLGEILYRLSSNILDDRTRGRERVFREIFAGLVDPKRGINRLMQGKTFRVTNKEIYQKEPLNISFYGGMHKINEETKGAFGKGTYSEILNIQLDYGNPFEVRSRKPFDFFKVRTDFKFGLQNGKILDNVNSYGILFGKNYQVGNLAILLGGFQYYDYWNNNTFELGAISFGGGLFSKLPLSKNSNLYTNVHLGLIPFAGNSRRVGPDTSLVRDYNFGDGAEAKIETTLILGKYLTASIIYYYYIIHTYVGKPGNNFISILKPRVTVKLYKNLSLGFEHYVYYNYRFLRDLNDIYSVKSEDKIFLLLYLEDPQRKGHYN